MTVSYTHLDVYKRQVWGMVSPDTMRAVAREFGGVEHRIEFVRALDGIKFYNDSIASSPTRAAAGLHSFDQKVILIAGGYDKHIPFDSFGYVLKECEMCIRDSDKPAYATGVEHKGTGVKITMVCGVTARV